MQQGVGSKSFSKLAVARPAKNVRGWRKTLINTLFVYFNVVLRP